jgi:spore germination protein YaaH
MTYDHNAASTRGAPNAPIEWVEDQFCLLVESTNLRITHFIGNKPPELRAKLLVGLNMYGTLFNPSRRPIVGSEYIQLLERYKPHIEWDSEGEETFWEFTDVEHGITEAEVWYPSLYSIKYIFLFRG